MAYLSRANRVRETTTSTGTGTINLDGVVDATHQTFVAGVGTAKEVHYCIVSRSPADGEWEVGRGTVTDATPDTLSRTTVEESSNGGALVDFSAGTKDVFILPTADEMENPSFRAYGDTDQNNIANDTHTKVQFNQEDWDTHDCYDKTTNYRFTPNKPGIYLVIVQIYWQFVDNGKRFAAWIYKNGAAEAGDIDYSSLDDSLAMARASALIDFNGTTDYVEAFGWHDNGDATPDMRLNNTKWGSFFSAVRVSQG